MKRIALLLCLLIPGVASAQETYFTQFLTVSPVVDTSAYATGDLIGSKLTYIPAVRPSTKTGVFIGAVISDLAAQTADMDLVLFSDNPTGTTFTDQAALDIADADLPKVIAVIPFRSTGVYTFADNGVHTTNSVMVPVKSLNSTIYAALVSRGTPTFASSADLKITLAIAED